MRGSFPTIISALFAAFALIPKLHAQQLVNIQTVTVGDAGNAADTTTYGAVAYEFNIGKYEVTISQYTTFLNSVAKTNTNSYIVDLWNDSMTSNLNIAGISRSGSGTLVDPYIYSVIGSGNRPIACVSWFDAARFANWMNNGATNDASTETGAYTLDGATSGVGFTKNAGATWWIPGENEWYKAAYYKGSGANAGYWVYPTKSDTAPGNAIGGATNQANYYAGDYAVTQSADYSSSQNGLTDVGAFSNSASAYDTYDQGGNLWEWNDAVIDSSRGLRGYSWASRYDIDFLQSSNRYGGVNPRFENGLVGFRIAGVPSAPTPITNVILTVEKAAKDSGGFHLNWTGSANAHMDVQRTTSLTEGTWSNIALGITNGDFTDPNPPADRAFYRVVPSVAPTPTPPPPTDMVLIPAGSFTMGDTLDSLSDASLVTTTLSAYYMDATEATYSHWQTVQQWVTLEEGYTGLAAGSGKGAMHPVQTVNWYDCVKWCNARSEKEGKRPVYYSDEAFTTVYKTGTETVYAKWDEAGYRLPTEAEWEKAARGGLSGKRFPWGDTISQSQANYNGNTNSYSYDLGPDGYNAIGSVGGTSPATSPVGSFAANGYGLHDMVGNVGEWCWDWYRTPYAGGSDPRGPATGTYRVSRGCCWISYAHNARCAGRYYDNPATIADYNDGFRAVLPLGQ